MKTALVLTYADDTHVRYVERHLQRSFITIDPEAISTGTELSFRVAGGKTHIVYDGKNLNEVGVVWYRKPASVRYIKLPVRPEHALYSSVSLERHVNLLKASFQSAFWVSDYYAIQKAANKSFQQVMASSLGFRVPDTITTSNPKAAAAFIKAHNAVVVKSTSPFPPNRKIASILPTRLITNADSDDLSGLHLAPSIFQEAIPTQADLRVTVVGEEVFPAIIYDKGVEEFTEIRDWRMAYDQEGMKFAPYEITKEVREQCVSLVKRLGLQFGAIDLILDKKGQLWFLEINPNGQWAFIEEDTGQPIGKSIATLMTKYLGGG